jgi:hypothetical protein
MKKIISILASALILANTSFAQAGLQGIKFTAVKNTPTSIQVFAKNVTTTAISGTLGASCLTISVGIPVAATSPNPVKAEITSPIAGQTFLPLLQNDSNTTTIYTWNGNGTTGVVDFAPDAEVLLATVAFTGLAADAPVKLLVVEGSGPSFFDACYIAPSGTDQTDYSNPFYSATPANLFNCNSTNDVASITCTSSVIAGTDIPTPVKFLSFYALKSGSDAKLTWTVESDNDNKYFDIERSTDGRTYTAFTRVNAFDNGKSVNTYETADNASLSTSFVYYRIKQVDKNGTVTYSLIRNLKLDRSAAISLYPNPARTTTKLVFDAAAAGKASVTIRDVAGKQVQQINIQLVKGINQQTLNVHTLPAGEYNVTINGTNLKETIKLSRVN